jgi:hypothetical protein
VADLDDIVYSCCSEQELSNSTSAVTTQLPIELRRRFTSILCNYLVEFGVAGTITRLNGRSVSQIFAEHQPGNVKVVASGVRDGVRYELLEADPDPADPTGPAER